MHVIITGASSGIGKALAVQYLNSGHRVSVCGRSLEKLVAAFGSNYNNLFITQANVAFKEDCKMFIKKAIQQHGEVDVLINNAGISMRAMFQDINLSVIQELMSINYWGAVYCTYYALTSIKKSQGVICGVSSIAGYRGLPARTGYSSSKFALQGFLEALRTEMLHTGVHVMWISPGFTASNIRNVALNNEGKSQGETPLTENKLMSAEECASRIIKGIQKRKRTIVMTTQGKLTVWLNKLFPALTDKLVYNHFKKEPDSPLS